MNLHTKVFFELLKKGTSKFQVTPTSKIPLPSQNATDDACLFKRVKYTSPNIIVPKKDEDVPDWPLLARPIISLCNRFSPFQDKSKQWSSLSEGKQKLKNTFGKYMPESKMDWNGHDPAGDKALEWWAFSGYGALELRTLTEEEILAESTDTISPFYISSYEFLSEFEVRKGLARYGGSAYFGRDGKIMKIKLHGQNVYPNEGKQWEYAKFVYRSSSFTWATIYHHLFRSHYNISNIASLATYAFLKADHPIRMFLKPFLYRTAAINEASCATLLPEGSLVHRATAFTWESMQEAYKKMLSLEKFKSFPDHIKQSGIADQLKTRKGQICHYAHDGLAYWNTVHHFISDVVDNSPTFHSSLQKSASQWWWKELNNLSNNELGDLTNSNLISYLTEFVFTVTAYHSFVGHVVPYVQDPSIVGGKIHPEMAMASQQASEQIAVITSMTGMEMPNLMGNFTHLMPDEHTRQSLIGFQYHLQDLTEDLTMLNDERAIPLHAFLPDKVSLSVSI